VEFRAKRIGWKGRADLLLLTESACEIVDFKTGAEAEEHTFQLQVYALLWSRDEELNPSGRLADKLTLAYNGCDVMVDAPTESQLQALEREVIARRTAARRAVEAAPPEARPAANSCRYCAVRQLCDSYWSRETQRSLTTALERPEAPFSDFDLTITGRHGPSSWDAQLIMSRDLPAGRRVVLRVSDRDPGLQVGQRVRILGAHVADVPDEKQQITVVTMGSSSEAYLV